MIVHEEEGVQLCIAEFATGRLSPIGPAGGATQQPVWSSDGARLAYRVGDRAFVHAPGVSGDVALATGVNVDAVRPYVFSPDGARVAVALRGSAIEVAADGGTPPRSLGTFPEHRVADIAWSPDGAMIMLLIAEPPPSSAAEIVRVPAAGGAATTQPADGVARFLGWRAPGELLALRSTGGPEALAVIRPAGITSLPVPGPYRVVDYLAATGELVLAREGEDTGDAALYRASIASDHAPQPWLVEYPALNDLRISADGQWALFIDLAPTPTGALGGRVVRVPIGAGAAQVVLDATAARAYSDAVPRPTARPPE